MENLKLSREQMNHRDVVAWIANKKEILENEIRQLFGENAWIKIYAHNLELPGEALIKENEIYYKNKVYHIIKNKKNKNNTVLGIAEANDNPRFDCLLISFNTL